MLIVAVPADNVLKVRRKTCPEAPLKSLLMPIREKVRMLLVTLGGITSSVNTELTALDERYDKLDESDNSTATPVTSWPPVLRRTSTVIWSLILYEPVAGTILNMAVGEAAWVSDRERPKRIMEVRNNF